MSENLDLLKQTYLLASKSLSTLWWASVKLFNEKQSNIRATMWWRWDRLRSLSHGLVLLIS